MAHDFKKFPELKNSQMDFYYWDSPHKQITEDFFAKVVGVIDGDTIKLRMEERDFDFTLRLAVINAPEMDEEDGIKSKNWLESRILGEEVLIKINPKNRVEVFGRLLGEVIHLGLNVGEESLERGYSSIWDDDPEVTAWR